MTYTLRNPTKDTPMIPAHIQAILDKRVHARPVATIVAVRDRTPQFTPSQSGSAPRRTLSTIVEAAGELDVHDLPMIDNADPDCFAVPQGE